VSDLKDRRAQKKAQTRELVRSTAHRLFASRGFDAVTIADVAREANVAVQTVFNHFATKEDLFFDGRAPWVTGVADAVLEREPGVSPLSGRRADLVRLIATQLGSLSSAEERHYRATLQASAALRTHETKLIFQAEQLLSRALLDAWQQDGECEERAPLDPAIAAPLTAAVWFAAVRVLIVENRLRVTEGREADEVAAVVEQVADRIFEHLQSGSVVLHELVTAANPDTDRPAHPQAG
jgi:AcrR family transcriptional regulator